MACLVDLRLQINCSEFVMLPEISELTITAGAAKAPILVVKDGDVL